MTRRPGRAGVAVVWIAGLLGLLALTAAVLIPLWSPEGLPVAANVAQLVSIPLAAIPLLVALSLWAWRRRRTAPVPVTEARLSQAQSAVALAAADRWTEEAALRGLLTQPIPVPWRVTDRDSRQDRPGAIATDSLLLLDYDGADLSRLAHDFRHRLTHRRLVLLGAAGTGKTSLAVLLLLKLLATRGPHDPVPVLLTATSWDPDRHPDLADWLTDRLTEDYPATRAPEFGADAPRQLVRQQRILPVLDGLDELAPATRARILTALNQSAAIGPLILTCRTTDFDTTVTHARQVLAGALVLEPEPLTPTTIARYLSGLPVDPHPAWSAILAALGSPDSTTRAHGPVAEVAATAWGLWLLRSVYFTPRLDATGQALRPPDPAPLLAQPTADRMRTQLFDELIPALIAARPPRCAPGNGDGPLRPRQVYDPTQVQQWLSCLADYLTPPTTMEPSRPTATVTPRPQASVLCNADDPPTPPGFLWWELARRTAAVGWAHRLLPGVAAALLLMMALVWPSVPITWLSVPPSVLFALFFGYVGWRVVGLWPLNHPGVAVLRIPYPGRRTVLRELRHDLRWYVVGMTVLWLAAAILIGRLLVPAFPSVQREGLLTSS
ncbi:hypothetical protein GCM10029964_091040 [Kibdelosporangium lantanae]